jgi:hypothetical protein
MKLLHKLYTTAKRVVPVLTVVLLTLQIPSAYLALLKHLSGAV